MNVKFYECVNEKKFKKESPKFDPRGNRTCNLVFPCSLLYHLHHHILLYILYFFMPNLNHAQFNFLAGLLLQILKKWSYDNQQEDIYIKPPSIEFLVWKGLLVTLRPKCGRKDGNLRPLKFQPSILSLEPIWPCSANETVEYLN